MDLFLFRRKGVLAMWRICKKFVSLFFSLFIIGVISTLIFLLYLRSQALPVSVVLQTTEIYDMNGKLIDSIYAGQNRDIVTLDKVSPYMIQSTLAVEDHRFYDHFGIDPMGIARAAYINLKNMEKAQGASTITQQLARNLYLNHERTWGRKIKEAILALQLEMRYDKNKILEQYLNQIYYGHAAYGVESASKLYFHKSSSELTLAESALLAGVPKGPKYYSPYMDKERAKERQKIVLQKMVEHGYITQNQASRAYREDLTLYPLSGDEPSVAPYFKDYVKYIATNQLGITEEQYNGGGIKIYTTLDLRAQQIAEETVKKHLSKEHPDLQGALISIDPRNGYIKAMVGGKDYEQNQFNRVFSNSRQPGSAFKPIVYLAALQQHALTPVSKYKSEPTAFTYDEGRKTYMPSNFGNKYPNKEVDLRYAISHSDNIYAVHTIMDVGADNVIAMARSLGIASPMKPLPSLALGATAVSPFEMVSAYAAIANQGVRVEPIAITRVEDGRGRILYEAQRKETHVIDPAYTYVLTKQMESVFDPGGTGYRVADKLRRPVAAKTGTTNTDAWMIGFTPELATAVWIGYDRDRKINSLESYLSAPIFAEFTEQTLEPIPPKLFPIPDGIISVYINPESGKLATENCPESRLEAFVKGTEPLEYCTVHGGADDGLQPLPSDQSHKEKHSWWSDLKRWWSE
jgi:1A family penicillin-binding protein